MLKDQVQMNYNFDLQTSRDYSSIFEAKMNIKQMLKELEILKNATQLTEYVVNHKK